MMYMNYKIYAEVAQPTNTSQDCTTTFLMGSGLSSSLRLGVKETVITANNYCSALLLTVRKF